MCCGCYIPSIYDYEVTSVREFLYELSFIGFIAAALDAHTSRVCTNWQPSRVGILGRAGHHHTSCGTRGNFLVCGVVRTSQTGYVWWVLGQSLLGPLEIVTGFTFLLLFGSGFYVGPAAIIIAGILRLKECKRITPRYSGGS